MVFVASEMERRGFDIPLLIGGATTSRPTPPSRSSRPISAGSTTYVIDASRAVGVVAGLLSEGRQARQERGCQTRAEYVRVREQYARSQQTRRPASPIDQARANRWND
jgi:5-methyltetrahydrofolate--homocysteine methyltransferase